jgi:hypothetical protein
MPYDEVALWQCIMDAEGMARNVHDREYDSWMKAK